MFRGQGGGELKGLSCFGGQQFPRQCAERQPPSQARTEFPQWMVGTDIDGRLPVTLEMDPKSKEGMGVELMKLIKFLDQCSGCRFFYLSLYPGCNY